MRRIISSGAQSMRKKRSDSTPPNLRRMTHTLRQVGYSFEQALSDLIDNSINANASAVLIRFICDNDAIKSLVIADDGDGMNEAALSDAMRFGTEEEASSDSLGKYGMGLKLASLSHAKCLTVITRQKRQSNARRWTIKGIEAGWECDVLDAEDAEEQMNAPWGDLDLRKSGTLVVWDEIDKLPTSKSGLNATIRTLQKRLQNHLGLCFHRFLEDDRLTICLDKQELGEDEHDISVSFEPLNPFGYSESGSLGYPKKFKASIDGVGALRVEGHIWPPNSGLPEYKLGGRTAARQGLYFYRNDRLIQAGGWNGIVDTEAEPHSSLARVLIDLPAKYDESFGLNVQKSAVIPPPGFEASIRAAVSDDGDSFSDYRHEAVRVYRKKDEGAVKLLPLIPGEGLPTDLVRTAKNIVTGGKGRVRKINFEWVEFETADLFEIDRDEGIIYLNHAYRRKMLGELRASKTDLPLFKALLFLITEEDFLKSKLSKKRKDRLEKINRLLVAAAKQGKG